MVNKLGRGEPPTPTNIAWNISPKVNAVFRNGSKEDKITLLKGFVGDIEPDQALKVATRCHRRQTEEVKAIFAECDENCIEHKNSVVAFIDNQYKEFQVGIEEDEILDIAKELCKFFLSKNDVIEKSALKNFKFNKSKPLNKRGYCREASNRRERKHLLIYNCHFLF